MSSKASFGRSLLYGSISIGCTTTPVFRVSVLVSVSSGRNDRVYSIIRLSIFEGLLLNGTDETVCKHKWMVGSRAEMDFKTISSCKSSFETFHPGLLSHCAELRIRKLQVNMQSSIQSQVCLVSASSLAAVLPQTALLITAVGFSDTIALHTSS